jgi:glutamyl-Q tRNA(Asp) synthetase
MNTPQNTQSSQGSSHESVCQANVYRGRFAPSPTGPLHLGSLATALGSWLDTRAHGGKWLVRIEDVDTPRTVTGADEIILQQLFACGLHWDEDVVWQSKRTDLYQSALDQIGKDQLIYRCICSRKEIEETLRTNGVELGRHEELTYPGSCRNRNQQAEKAAIRLALPNSCVLQFTDRIKGIQSQDLVREVGDFVLRRADGLFTYQLAVVVDDHLQGITHIVRGEDLLSNTARQLYLQKALGYPMPNYLHLALVKDEKGEKLSKQSKAMAIDISDRHTILKVLNSAALHLGLHTTTLEKCTSISAWLSTATRIWQETLSQQNKADLAETPQSLKITVSR